MAKAKNGAGLCQIADNIASVLHGEEGIREKTDSSGNIWLKVYFGSGSHFNNWLSQVLEIFGAENVEVEPIDFTGLTCFEESDEKAHRIWVKKQQ